MVILVARDRVVYELDLQYLKLEDGILAKTEGIISPYRSYCDSGYRISRNGSRLVGYYIRCPEWPGTTTTRGHAEEHSAALDIGKTRLELRMFEISQAADQIQTLELEHEDHKSPEGHTHVITFSPDLTIVQAGAHIFDLLAPGHPRLSFPDSPLDKARQGENSSITFSSCTRYLVLIKSKDNEATDSFATYGIFRIYRAVGRIEKRVIPGLDDLVADGFSIAFHPELPLPMLKYFTCPESSVREAAGYINVIEIDLEALKHTPVKIPKRRFDDEYETIL